MASTTTKSTAKTKVGRPSVMTADVIRKLEDAFSIGASDREATFYAGIAMSTLYDYQTAHPEFVERKEALKEKPIMLARQTVVKAITTDPKMAMEYLKAKKRDEFASRQELTGKDGAELSNPAVIYLPANGRDPDPTTETAAD